LDPLPIEKMWGVGKVTKQALARLHIRTFKDLNRTPVEVLERAFGRHGVKMHLLSMGVDKRDVVTEHDVKSIGHEETFAEDILDSDAARRELLSLAYRVARRMRREGREGGTVTLKVKYSDFRLVTRSITLKDRTDDAQEIYMTACSLMEKTSAGRRPVRLLGISMSHFSAGSEAQLSLFSQKEQPGGKKELHAALDSIEEKFGKKGIRPGTLLKR
ncbi:MAG TPA: DNA polymerase IV, partial [Geoalkalibacter subterraneus]|nr:DNA polymerase IV [Geoalkalibacter subterraneus]